MNLNLDRVRESTQITNSENSNETSAKKRPRTPNSNDANRQTCERNIIAKNSTPETIIVASEPKQTNNEKIINKISTTSYAVRPYSKNSFVSSLNSHGEYDRCLLIPQSQSNNIENINACYTEKNSEKAKQTKTSSDKKCNGEKELIVLLLNIRSIRNKLNELEIFIDSIKKKPNIIIITESWLRDNETQFFNLKNYQSVTNCRTNQRGGGIIVFIKDEIGFNVPRNDQVANSHFIVIHLIKFKIKISAFYRSPSTKPEQFIEKLEGILDKTDNLICFGDANYDLFKPNDTNVQSIAKL